MDAQLAAVLATQGGCFTTAQALAQGYDGAELSRLERRGELFRLRRGVWTLASHRAPLDAEGRYVLDVRGALLHLHPQTVVSHTSAAVLLRLSLLEPDLSVVHVTRPDLKSSRSEAGIHHHAAGLSAATIVEQDGVMVTSPARTVLDIARTSSFVRAVVVADSALRFGSSPEELLELHLAYQSWVGSRAAGRVVAFADGRAESAGESVARVLFAEQDLPAPEPQYEVHDADGFVGRADWGWPRHRTLGEFDGRVKYRLDAATTPEEASRILWAEKLREDRLRELGFEVVRFVWSDLYRPAATAARVRRAFARAAARHGISAA